MPRLLEGREAVGHLLRRAGFGPTPAQWEAFGGLPYEEAVERVLGDLATPDAADPPGFEPFDPGAIQDLWLERMRAAPIGFAEKLTLFWHGHFATSQKKLEDPWLLWEQRRLLRRAGPGPFADLVLGVSRDVAMIRWLDGNSNRVGHANENYARELQELFTLGIGNYTETDVREVARAFTGWGSRHHEFVFRPEFHDAGEKTVHGQTGRLGGEDVVRILVGQPACAAFLARKLLTFFSHADPSPEEVAALAEAYRECGLDTTRVLRHLFLSPGFRDERRRHALVKSPVEFLVSGMRLLDVGRIEPWMHGSLDYMGQILFNPPSVKGWPSGSAWLSSAGVIERLRAAQRLSEVAAPGALDGLVARAFDGRTPPTLAPSLEGRSGRALAAVLLGSPEFQLA